jgi:3-oxoadipate enol-lactonase
MNMVRPHELVPADMTVRYWIQGVEDSPTLEFLHGATLDHRSWDPQVRALQRRYRIVTVDLRGRGLPTLDGRFDFGSALEDVMALLHRLRATPLVLVGLSLGGNIAQEIVYHAPELVDALIVADSACNTAPRHPLQAPMAIAALAPRGMTSREPFLKKAAQATSQDEKVQQSCWRSTRTSRPVTQSRSSRRCWRARCTPTLTTGCRCPPCSSTATATGW